MSPRKYPPLTPREIISILKARGFSFDRSKGDHDFYVGKIKGKKKITHVDKGTDKYNARLIKAILRQTGLTREEFYCSTKSTAKKINLKSHI